MSAAVLVRQDKSTDDIENLIRDAGREPIERDTLYNVVRIPAVLGS